MTEGSTERARRELEHVGKKWRGKAPKRGTREMQELADFVSAKGTAHLKAFQRRNEDTTHINYKVYHLLCQPFTYINAYANIAKNKGARTKGIHEDDEIMKFFGQSDALHIAQLFREKKYVFKPVRRTLISKPGKPTKKRPINTPSQRDRIVQEALRGILEAVFEPEFVSLDKASEYRSSNYGFRPDKQPFDAVDSFRSKGQRCNYVIEGDISSAYNSIRHTTLINCISRRIKDKAFLKVIRDCLRSGIMEKDGKVIHSLTGTRQGGIVSPILFNIYMFELDKWMLKYMSRMCVPKGSAQRSPAAQRITYEVHKVRNEIHGESETSSERLRHLKKKLRALIHLRSSIPSYTVSTLPKGTVFIRYADDWIFGVTCTKAEAKRHKRCIQLFLRTFLSLELDPTKTLVSHLADEGFCFLGFQIRMWSNRSGKLKRVVQRNKYEASRVTRRTTSRKISVRPDAARIYAKLRCLGVCNGALEPIGVRPWTILEEYRIVQRYAGKMRGITNYYCECVNPYVLNRVSYILQYSCAKTIATRKKITMSQVFKKYGKSLTIQHTVMGKSGEINLYEVSFPTFTELKKAGILNKMRKDRWIEPDAF